MIKKFPFFKKEYILRRFEVKEGTKIAIYGIYNKERIELNEDALFIVKHLTGWHSVEEIANKISSKYQIGYDKAFESLNKILSQLKSKEIISFNENREVKYEFSNLPQMRGVLNHVYILLTNACNFRCPHCSVNAGKKLKEELKKEEIFYIVDQIYEMMVPGVTFTGGEPTLVDYLPELIKYTASKPIKTHLMTNGYKINREYAELLVRNGLVHVNISLDGAKEETHDTFRKTKGAFKRAIEAIKIFKELNIYVETTTVIHEGNNNEIIDIVNLGKSLKVDNMKFLPIIPFKRGKSCNFSNSLRCYTNNIKNFIGAYEDYYKSLIKKDLSQKVNKEEIFRCGAGTGVLGISPEGNVLPCNNLENIVLGNVRTQKLIDIYNESERLRELYEAISIRGSECENCEILDFCHGGCAMIAWSYHEDYKKCDITRRFYVMELMKDYKWSLP